MPSTVNGIGTHYYGKANRSSRQGACQSCGRTGNLESYDTRLWFVIVFIPIIPLGRKRIMDMCPSCHRHYVSALGKWEDQRQMTNSGTKAEFVAQPTPENAERHHRGLLAFHQHQEAASFMKEALEHFSTDAPLHAYFAAVQHHLGHPADAGRLYERALELNRELPAARHGMALLHMNAGNLEAATELLEHLRAPGAAQLHDISPLENLALAYQKRSDHAEALEQFNILLRELPSLGDHTGFRKMVAVSEKALKQTKAQSFLPERKFSWKRLWLEHRRASIVCVLVVLGTAGSIWHNFYLAKSAPLHVANGYPTALRLKIDGGPEQVIHPGYTKITLPEGPHELTMDGAVKETLRVDIRRGFFDRWANDNAWLLNPGGRAIIIEQPIYYVKDGHEVPDSIPEVFTGARLLTRYGINYFFTEPPKQMTLSDGTTYLMHRQLRLHPGSIQEVVDYYAGIKLAPQAMQLCEEGIVNGTATDDMIMAYGNLAVDETSKARIARVLKVQVAKRPVQVALHRVWQDLQTDMGKSESDVVAEYIALSDAAPADAALLYLRARKEPDTALQSSLLKKCTEMQGAPSWCWYARAYDHAAAGEWQTALPMIEKAVSMDGENSRFADMLQDARRVLGEWKPLIETLQTKARLNPQSMVAHLSLVEAHMMQGDANAAQAVSSNYFKRIQVREDGRETAAEFALLTADLLGNDEFILQQTPRAGLDSLAGNLREPALVMARRWSDLEAGLQQSPHLEDPLFHLAAALAAKMDGSAEKAGVWLDRALSHLKPIDDSGSIAAALKSSTPPAPATIDLSSIALHQRAVVWAWLAVSHPAPMKQTYAGLARSFNMHRYFPARLVIQASTN
ncbi:tetratricopeptide repeat protein [Brevifollis gellanilyticus]|uniref:Tetratricopeptide repeat protein n=1 Tax=Brevifollis gellanilyticus TaxID=748831 RepID=A0A512M540_9BACT|nr:hypothetical protein [Brevifollis gellanilyticus]GEP41847.1 hypothetical protein BGE01nite_11380 [Brevifollis gellanilyticus]